MRFWPSIPLVTMAAIWAGCSPQKAMPPGPALAWAYPTSKQSYFQLPAGAGPFHVPGSALGFSQKQVVDDENPVDWFPREHPSPPSVVSRNDGSGPTPCAECHLYNGRGFLGATDLNGLPPSYIVEQVKAFRSGERRSAEADRFDTAEMIKVAEKVSDSDLFKAAAYFAALPRAPRLQVEEAVEVPATKPDQFGWLDVVPGREPTGARVIEVSEDMARSLLGDDHINYIDYAPIGAVNRGETLVRTVGPGGLACRSCHGPDLRGAGDIPPLAGRSAPYLARMLWDIKSSARRGPTVAQMQAPARSLTESQILDISAYLASLKP